MQPAIRIDADEMGVERRVMDCRERNTFGTTGWPSRSSLSATMWAASSSNGSGNPDNAQRPL
jgi:hypothetical protein